MTQKTQDSPEYLEKKRFFNQILTIYGRNPVHEALQDKNVTAYRLHLADSNKPSKAIEAIISLAKQKGADVLYHSKSDLSRISKNAKQDQGIAVDLKMSHFHDFDEWVSQSEPHTNGSHMPIEFIALDRVTNPQNVGMIIRSVCASPMHGLILPRQGCAKLDSLVIKASAGAVFKAKIYRCDNLAKSLAKAKEQAYNVVGLEAFAKTPLQKFTNDTATIFVMGNETDGLSEHVKNVCTHTINIPMNNNVESLNVAVTASLLAFRRVT